MRLLFVKALRSELSYKLNMFHHSTRWQMHVNVQPNKKQSCFTFSKNKLLSLDDRINNLISLL